LNLHLASTRLMLAGQNYALLNLVAAVVVIWPASVFALRVLKARGGVDGGRLQNLDVSVHDLAGKANSLRHDVSRRLQMILPHTRAKLCMPDASTAGQKSLCEEQRYDPALHRLRHYASHGRAHLSPARLCDAGGDAFHSASFAPCTRVAQRLVLWVLWSHWLSSRRILAPTPCTCSDAPISAMQEQVAWGTSFSRLKITHRLWLALATQERGRSGKLNQSCLG
jgi:hypothetical protein